MEEFELMNENEGIPLFKPYIPKNTVKYVTDTLNSRWIGEGPKVKHFEKQFAKFVNTKSSCVAVNSGTAALHLSYILSGVKKNDEVICPLFTCTATNLPILYQGAIPIFCDISKNNLNMNVDDIEGLITEKTKAVTVVDYGGVPNNYKKLRNICDKYNLKLISDCAHCLDGEYRHKRIHEWSDFTIYSFQAIKTMTTGDGGMLICSNVTDEKLAKKIRWFGIDRQKKQQGIWENDVLELGFKYHMNDIAASIGIASLEEIEKTLKRRRQIFSRYKKNLKNIEYKIFENNQYNSNFTPWLLTLNCGEKRIDLMNNLRKNGIESAQVHYRNDRYSIFGKQNKNFKNMDAIEDSYLVIPMYPQLRNSEIDNISKIILKVLQ